MQCHANIPGTGYEARHTQSTNESEITKENIPGTWYNTNDKQQRKQTKRKKRTKNTSILGTKFMQLTPHAHRNEPKTLVLAGSGHWKDAYDLLRWFYFGGQKCKDRAHVGHSIVNIY